MRFQIFWRKLLSVLIVVSFLLEFFPGVPVVKAATDWTGYTAISSKADLYNIRNNLTGNYYLTDDIVFSEEDFAEGGAFYNDGAGWIPIGSSSSDAFAGTFDGKGHVITGLVSNTSSSKNDIYAGMFGYNRGTIENLGITNSSIQAYSPSQAFVGGIAGINEGTIRNSYNKAEVTAISPKTPLAGGIAGQNYSGTISNVYNAGNVNTSSTSSSSSNPYAFIGGIAGDNYAGTVSSSYNMGNVNAVSKSTNYNNTFVYSGGIIGVNVGAGAVIRDCFNIGSVNVTTSFLAYIGGISGGSNGGAIANTYNAGSINSNSGYGSMGEIVGDNGSDSISNSYFLNRGIPGSGSGVDNTTPLSAEQMKYQAFFQGFDFTNTWQMSNNLPYLKAIQSVELTSLSFDTNEIQLATGATYSIKMDFTPATPNFFKIKYTSLDENIATVNQNGVISASGVGTTNIIAKDIVTNKVDNLTVKVVQGVTGISINGSPSMLKIGNTMQLSATVMPADAANKNVTWSSSDSSVVSVDQNGIVKAKSPGTVTIYAASTDGTNKKASFNITVMQNVQSISLNIDSLKLKVGESQALSATVLPADATNSKVIWSSSEPSVATVDANGMITAKSSGTSVITAKTEDGGFEDVSTVTVYQPVTGVSFANPILNIGLGGQVKLVPTISPANANNQNVTWESSDPSVSISSDGVIKGESEGQSVITVTTQDGNKTAISVVNVGKAVTDITLNKTDMTLIEGQVETLNVTGILPTDGINKDVLWKSSDPSVAIVDEQGNVTAVKPGNATISAEAADGSGVTANCDVTVNAKSLTKIEVTTLPKKLIYNQMSTFDSTGMALKLTYDNGTTSTVTSGWQASYDFSVLGTRKVAIQYGGKTTEISVTVNPFTVTFNSNGGSAVANKTASYNTIIAAPTPPTRTGYTFGGWYKDAAYTNSWNFAANKVMNHTTLYAKWVANPAIPGTVKAASSSYNSVKVSWGPVAGVSGYEIYRATSSTGKYTLLTATTATSYINTGLITNSTYYYKIRAYKLSGTTKAYSGWSTVVSAKPKPAIPASVKAASSSYNSIKTSWAAVSGATGYEVYRATTLTGQYSYAGRTTATSFTNTGLVTNYPYYFKVRAYRLVGTTKVYSSFSAPVSAKAIPSVPINFKAARYSSSSIKVSWGSVSGATGYEVYRATSKTGNYSPIKTTSSVNFINTGLTKKKTYYYKVRAYRTVGKTKVYSSWSTIVSAYPY
ncbi:Ig-like domain-containing protein [Peribacillus sp. NPDC055009]